MKNSNNKTKILSTILLSFSLLPIPVLAICEEFSGGLVKCSGSSCSFSDLVNVVCNIISFITNCLTPIFAVLMIVIGGLYFLLAAGDQGKIETGKKVLLAAVIGLVVVFLAGNLLKAFLSLPIFRTGPNLCQ